MIEKIKASKSEKIIFIFLIVLGLFSFGSFFLIKNKCLFVKDYDPYKIKFNEKYFERVIHHEVFHIINDSFKEIFDEKVWSEFNIKNFKYAECSTCTDKIGLDTYKKTEGFFTEYSRSTASEDMAEVFSHLMIGSNTNNSDPI